METMCKGQHRPGLGHDRSEFSFIIIKGLLNVPMSSAKKAEAGLCQQKNSVTTTETAQPHTSASCAR